MSTAMWICQDLVRKQHPHTDSPEDSFMKTKTTATRTAKCGQGGRRAPGMVGGCGASPREAEVPAPGWKGQRGSGFQNVGREAVGPGLRVANTE